ncbi:uncharacterized protein IWZ02DRAFT_31270 [Phyllosticta citriasiana]|uniref:uncharacterized protein n=1 Tax=Phyllosticta citriasiana TaxID=595635 RepID=UPI0030FD2837
MRSRLLSLLSEDQKRHLYCGWKSKEQKNFGTLCRARQGKQKQGEPSHPATTRLSTLPNVTRGQTATSRPRALPTGRHWRVAGSWLLLHTAEKKLMRGRGKGGKGNLLEQPTTDGSCFFFGCVEVVVSCWCETNTALFMILQSLDGPRPQLPKRCFLSYYRLLRLDQVRVGALAKNSQHAAYLLYAQSNILSLPPPRRPQYLRTSSFTFLLYTLRRAHATQLSTPKLWQGSQP